MDRKLKDLDLNDSIDVAKLYFIKNIMPQFKDSTFTDYIINEIAGDFICEIVQAYRENTGDGIKWLKRAPPKNRPILRYHIIWKCVVSVQHRNGKYQDCEDWINSTKDNSWPEEAFFPEWAEEDKTLLEKIKILC